MDARSDDADSAYAWFRLAICLLIGTTGSVGMWSVVVVLPPVEAEFVVDRADASIPYTTTMIGFALGNVLLGRLVDRAGIVLPMLVAALALGGGYFLSALSTGIWQFALFQGLLIGVGSSATFGPIIADVSHWFRRHRGIAVATAACGNYLGGALWPLAMQEFIPSEGWRATYVGIGIVCIAVILPLSLLLRHPPPRDGHVAGVDGAGMDGAVHAGTVKATDLSPNMLQTMLVIAGLGCCVAMSMPQVHIVAYCADLGFGVARGAEMLSLMLAGGVVSRLLSGLLADHIGGVRTLLIGSVLQGISLLLYIPFDGLASLYAVSLIFGLSQGGIVPCYAIIVREYLPAAEAGQRVGIVIMATIVGMAFGGWISGWIYDVTGSYSAAFLHGIGWNLLNITVMALVLWRTRQAKAVPA